LQDYTDCIIIVGPKENDRVQDDLNSIYARMKTPADRAPHSVLSTLKGPDLAWVSPAFETAAPRVAIVGQQQLGWDYSYKEFIENWSIEKAVESYKKFNFAENYVSSPFWQFFEQIRNHFFGDRAERSIVAWFNLVKFVTKDEESILGQSFEEDALRLQDGIFAAELAATKPDICIFVTGPDYDRTDGGVKSLFLTKWS
jgi:hypothetical protein